MVEEGMVTINVEFTQLGFQVTGKAMDSLRKLDSSLEENKVYPLMFLHSIAEAKGLLERPSGKKGKKGGKVEQPLPAKSLCKRDFQGTTPQQLANRMSAVANKAGGGTLTGRARQSGSFNGQVTTSFQDWWESATAKERASSLCQSKDLAELNDDDINRLGGSLQCPFRGTAEFLVSQADEESDEDEPHQTQPTPAEAAKPKAPKEAKGKAANKRASK